MTSVWDPHTLTSINQLESVERVNARMCVLKITLDTAV